MDNCKVNICEEGFCFEAAERETVITADDIDRDWNVCTRQQSVMSKLKKVGVEPYKVNKVGDRIIEAEYRLPFSQLSFCGERKKKIYTEEQKENLRKRFIQNRNE